MTTPGPWEAIRSRVAGLVARRDAVLAETARAWVGFARRQGWSPEDVERLWEGLTEDLVRQVARARTSETAGVRREVLAVMAGLRGRILDGLAQREAGA